MKENDERRQLSAIMVERGGDDEKRGRQLLAKTRLEKDPFVSSGYSSAEELFGQFQRTIRTPRRSVWNDAIGKAIKVAADGQSRLLTSAFGKGSGPTHRK